MATMFNASVDTREIDRLLVRSPALFREAVRLGIERSLLLVSRNMQGRVTRRSGRRAGSWLPGGKRNVFKTETTSSGARGRLGSNLVYDAMQEYGGVQKARNARYLAIPLGPAKTKAGVSKHKSPRRVPDLFPLRSKKGNLLLVKRTAQGAIRPWYVLKRQVVIPATHDLRDSIRDAGPKMPSILEAAAREQFRKVA